MKFTSIPSPILALPFLVVVSSSSLSLCKAVTATSHHHHPVAFATGATTKASALHSHHHHHHDYGQRRKKWGNNLEYIQQRNLYIFRQEQQQQQFTTIRTMTSSSSPTTSSQKGDVLEKEKIPPTPTPKKEENQIPTRKEAEEEEESYNPPTIKTVAFNRDLLEDHPAHDILLSDVDLTIENETSVVPLKPAMSFEKFLTMQDKRVVVTIRYSEGLRPFFLTTAKKIKENHPHVVIEKRILPFNIADTSPTSMVFEVLVDGKICIGKRRMKKQNVRSSSSSSSSSGTTGNEDIPDLAGGRSVYISMDDLEIAIAKARKRRRPSTYYGRNQQTATGGDNTSAAMRLEMLRKHRLEKGHAHDSWAD